MTGFGVGTGFCANKSVEQALARSAAPRASAAARPRAAPMPAARCGAWISGRLRRMGGLRSTLGGIARLAAAGERDRHPDAEMRPRIFPIDDLDGAAVCGDELEHHGEPDSRAFDGRRAGRAAGIEGLEYVVALFLGDAGAIVGDIDGERVGGGGCFDVNGAPLWGIFDGIRYQILENQADFAAISDERHILHLHVQAYALRKEGELLVLQHLLHYRSQTELGRLQTDTGGGLPGAEGEEVLDHPLQLDAVVAQDGGDLPLTRVELAHRAIHEQLRAFPDVGEGSLELVGHVAEESIALLRELEQPQAQPFELLAQALEVMRTSDADRIADVAVADVVDHAVDVPQGTADDQRQREDGNQGERQEQRGLPEQPCPRAIGLALERGDLGVDLLVTLLSHFV